MHRLSFESAELRNVIILKLKGSPWNLESFPFPSLPFLAMSHCLEAAL